MERTEETGDGGEPGTTMEAPPQQSSLMAEERKKKNNLKVLVAVDESDGSFYALQWTLDNIFKRSSAAASTTGAGEASTEPDPELGMITVLHVMKPYEHYTFPVGPSVYATSAVVESVRKAQQENAAEILARAFEICTQRGIKAETLIMEGDPKDMICHAVEEMHFDLLVVGSHGHGMIKRAFLGSVSDYCAHHAKCPILIVKFPKERQHHK